MRAAGPPRLANPPSPTDRRVRLHRGLLQPPTPPLDPGLRQPRHLRAPAHPTSTCRIATVSTKPGQLQANPTGGKSTTSQSTGTLDATGCRPHVLTAIQQVRVLLDVGSCNVVGQLAGWKWTRAWSASQATRSGPSTAGRARSML